MKKTLLLQFIISFLFVHSFAQTPIFTIHDTLRGTITPERAWWDLTYYHLDIEANPYDSSLRGSNTIYYKVLSPGELMQIDLQEPMTISRVVQNEKELGFRRFGNVYFIELKDNQIPGECYSMTIFYHGNPRVTKNPPWDAVLTWDYDDNGNPFFATSCQGDGAGLWWPCKDHMYDEPDSMLMSYTVPKGLIAIGNGRLMGVEKNKKDKTITYHWSVSNPINNYCVNMNVGKYVHFGEVYNGEKGPLDCDYYVLNYNQKKAINHFKQVPLMLEAFEFWFGPYPFYDDSYKLVEVPYPGMEHQSSITYGNGWENGFNGRDISQSGWGDKFDFIIIHESGHEWFANSITYKDIADMWVHESFTAYSENLYVDYHYGKEASSEYVRGTRLNIKNDRPIIGYYDVNYPGSGDMYPKGANMLHTIRQLVNDDEKWRKILRGLNETFYHQTVTTGQIEEYLDERVAADLSLVFNQYLRDVRIPVFEYAVQQDMLKYRWANVIDGFNMPLYIYLDGSKQLIHPTTQWSTMELHDENTAIEVDQDFYVIPYNVIQM